jgi:hypothetical protein
MTRPPHRSTNTDVDAPFVTVNGIFATGRVPARSKVLAGTLTSMRLAGVVGVEHAAQIAIAARTDKRLKESMICSPGRMFGAMRLARYAEPGHIPLYHSGRCVSLNSVEGKPACRSASMH